MMSRYEARLLQLQLAAEECRSEEDRHLILGELAAMKAAVVVRGRVFSEFSELEG